jgi:hypothetical protein
MASNKYRFSLRCVFVVVAALCIVLASVAQQRLSYRSAWHAQLQSVEQIEAKGGSLFFDEAPRSIRENASWLQRIKGDRFFHRVRGVYFGDRCGDLEFSNLQDLTDLPIRLVVIRHSNTDGTGLSYLRSLPNLEELHIIGCQLHEHNWRHIAELKNLKVLVVQARTMDETAVEFICRASSLQEVDLSGTTVSDKSLVYFRALHNLRVLRLCETSITDDGIANLGSMPSLEELDLGKTAITDEALIHLHRMEGLKKLSLLGTRTSNGAVQKIGEALEDVSIQTYDRHGQIQIIP